MIDLKLYEGTCLIGTIEISYKKIRNLLGEPLRMSPGDKMDVQWEIAVNDKVAIIYNYKDGPNYLGEDGIPVEKIDIFHIGGSNKEDGLEVVRNLFPSGIVKPFSI